MSSKKDNFYLNLALNLAKDVDGLTGSNPAVGSIIVKNNEIISSGLTGLNGRPHSEYNAITSCNKKKINGSTLYVTLEPCTHYGKTPPCVNLIIRSKISRVVYGSQDVDIRTARKAYQILKKNKIKVHHLNSKKIYDFYKPYRFHKLNKVPFITGKIACSNENFIYYKNFKYITNEYSRKFAHLLRYRNQAILISYKTINADNPHLDCRLKGLENFSPKIIVLDKNLRSNVKSNILKNAKNLQTIFFYSKANSNKIKLFKSKKIKLIKIKTIKKSKFDLNHILKKIYKLGICHFLLEGGKNLTEEFLNKELINQFYLIKSHNILGKNGKININRILNKLPKTFSSKSIVNTYVDKDKIIRYF